MASDGSQTITGPIEVENLRGVYTGSDVRSLSGPGKLVITRSCSFSSVNVTYNSTATINVTWYPPNALTTGSTSASG